MHVIRSAVVLIVTYKSCKNSRVGISWAEPASLFLNHFNADCDDSCAGNCTGKGPKGCIECANGYVKSDEEGCKGTFKLNVFLF